MIFVDRNQIKDKITAWQVVDDGSESPCHTLVNFSSCRSIVLRPMSARIIGALNSEKMGEEVCMAISAAVLNGIILAHAQCADCEFLRK